MAKVEEPVYVNDIFRSNNPNNDKVHARIKADREKAEAAAKGESKPKAPSFPGK